MDNWRLHQFVGVILLSVFLAGVIQRKYGWIAAVTLLYFMVSACVMFQTNIPFWDQWQFRIESTAAASYAKMFGLSFLALYYDHWRRDWIRLVEGVLLLQTGFIFWYGFGIFNAYSMDVAMIACVMPIMYLRKDTLLDRFPIYKYTLWVLPIVALIKAGGSTSWFVLMGGALGWMLTQLNRRALWGLIPICMAIAIGLYVNPGKFLHTSNRIETWKVIMDWWWRWGNPYYGTGTGSFEWLAPLSQITAGAKNHYFLWAHNDYLQQLYEGGFIGLGLCLLLWGQAMWLSYRRPWLFSTFMAISVCMLAQFPMRWAAGQFLLLAIMCEALCDKYRSSTMEK